MRAQAKAQVLKNIAFEIQAAQGYTSGDYDLVTVFDALHHTGDPVGAVANIRRNPKSDGALTVIEPMAGDRLEHNLHPVGRLYYAFRRQLACPPR